MKLTPTQYNMMTSKVSPSSKTFKNVSLAFLTGGIICVIGQLLQNIYMYNGMEKQEASTLVSVTLVALGAFLTAIKVYDNIAKHAGAGTLLPITGFANAMVSPAMEFKTEGHVLGLGAKMFLIAGPVIVFGIISSVAYGIIVYLFNLY